MNIEWLLNKAKQKFYPITHAKAVLVGENNETLDTELGGIKNDLGGLSFSVSGTTLSITDGTNTWTLSQ